MDLREVKGLLYLLTHLSPRMRLNLGEFELGVVGVHLADLLSGRGAENLERRGKKQVDDSYLLGVQTPFLWEGVRPVTLMISTS